MKNDTKFQELYHTAHLAGMDAVARMTVTPMVVCQHANVMNDASPVTQSWVVPDGPCGFAWIVVSPGNCSFANWLKKNKLADKHYYGGVAIWVGLFNQSMQKKEEYAYAFASVLVDAGINAYAGSRMD